MFGLGLLSAIGKGIGILRDLLGEPLKDFARWAAEDPAAAAVVMDGAASVLKHRASRRRRQEGWLARRDRALSASAAEFAGKLRDLADKQDERKVACGNFENRVTEMLREAKKR